MNRSRSIGCEHVILEALRLLELDTKLYELGFTGPQAARVSQRRAYFHLGDLIEVGSPDRVFTNPRHRLTEDYIAGRFG